MSETKSQSSNADQRVADADPAAAQGVPATAEASGGNISVAAAGANAGGATPNAGDAAPSDGAEDAALLETTPSSTESRQQILANSRFICEIESKVSMLADEVDARCAALHMQIESHASAIADRFLTLETLSSVAKHASPRRVAGVKRPRDGKTRRTAPSVVFREGKRVELKTAFSLDMLLFVKGATSKLTTQEERVAYCADNAIHIGALIRNLRRTFRGREHHGTWWWEAGIQSTFPAPPNFKQAKK